MGKELPPSPKKSLLIPPFSVHPLHTQEFVEHVERSELGGYFVNRHRRSGRSTAIALSSVAEAIRNPGKPVYLFDHYHGRSGLEHMVMLVEETIEKLGFREMRIFKDRKGTYLMLGSERWA